ncbi:MAG: translesion error-prone DNA polymerase V autoproteolytic subunit [Gammaproteobacteria bacterium]|nr:translesion error-prone DNA polymerase V autoproteolytic subunit [Gammaproteobacteria bacterium]MBU1654746.1 translesion error-prone DNA polymerase V autoproteolytic subunit [Gammaproteobacteria bacterium]MBU1961621.1 translesion error-prone DNA polymerase V autoproteolytic subunit [Gammaproteobacteria bacterium]
MPRGGKRAGAGRPPGQGKFGEPTRPIRVPVSMLEAVYGFVERRHHALPLYGSKVSAGFPSPADDYLEGTLDLNEHLVKHPAATFFVRVSGDSMLNAGIHPGDILVVDRSLTPVSGRIVIAALDGELTVKRFDQRNGRTRLLAENPAYAPIEIQDGNELHIWGVVTNVIHPV